MVVLSSIFIKNNMKRIVLLLLLEMTVSISTCFAQVLSDQALFVRQSDGTIIPQLDYIDYPESDQPSVTGLGNAPIYHSYPISSSNGNYSCTVKILGQLGTTESSSHMYERIAIVNQNGSIIFSRFGGDGAPFTTTKWLSLNENDNNYYRKIPLDANSYALIFAGWFYSYYSDAGEMVIVVVNKNVATLVYDGPAIAISETDFNFPNYYCQVCGYVSNQSFGTCPQCHAHDVTSDFFSMSFVKDGTGLINLETGLVEITPAKLTGKTKYTLYKDGNNLRIKEWR
jgi:hypothetical protein